MPKRFNVTGICIPERHYMVDTGDKIQQIIHDYIEQDAYFTINRARQYGKTTTLRLLEHALEDDYLVIRISFEGKEEFFATLQTLAGGLCLSFGKALKKENCELAEIFAGQVDREYPMQDLGERISRLCSNSEKKVVLMIDEVDKAADNQTFLSFLGMLREMYLAKVDYSAEAFSSVILTGVHDIKNLKMKLRPEEGHSYNSPWNIAADFNVDMSFSKSNIAGMLKEYELDYHTGMDAECIAGILYEYTSGYPYLISRICKIMDEQIVGKSGFETKAEVWTAAGVAEAIKELMKESNTLFDDMRKKIEDYSELRQMLHAMLFTGKSFPYNPDNFAINIGVMFGFIKEEHGMAVVANRVFETRLYNLFLSEDLLSSSTYQAALLEKNQFVQNGKLDMELVLRKFVSHFSQVYGDSDERFLEENGRRLFLLYLKPIINGVGNYYIEARTRDMSRTDVIVDYHGEQSIVEMKIWRGEAYNQRGEAQLAGYLEHYHLKKGYLLSFNFNKSKQVGVKTLVVQDKIIVEAVV